MIWVTSGVTWETTRAPTLLANLFTIICCYQRLISSCSLRQAAINKNLNWLNVRTSTCSEEPSPDETSTSLALGLSVGGLVFSLSSCPSVGESQLFVVLAAEVKLGVLDSAVSFTADSVCRGTEKRKLHLKQQQLAVLITQPGWAQHGASCTKINLQWIMLTDSYFKKHKRPTSPSGS